MELTTSDQKAYRTNITELEGNSFLNVEFILLRFVEIWGRDGVD